jgi:hypothetical protein
MRVQGRQIRSIAGLFAGMSLAVWAGEFAPPAEGPVAFRRDQLPLDVDTMSELSQQLASLAKGVNGTTAPARRRAAQLIALALALDPANTKAREWATEYQQHPHRPPTDAGPLESLRTRIRQQAAWLESTAAGSEGQALAACLKDVLPLTDPQLPGADPGNTSAEIGAWAGWVSPLSAYEDRVLPKEDIPEKPAPIPPPKQPTLLGQAKVHIVLWKKSGKDASAQWALTPSTLQMSAVKLPGNPQEPPPFSLVIGSNKTENPFSQMGDVLKNLLTKYHETLPTGYCVSITSPELEPAILAHKHQSLSAAAAVLASSAITRREPDAIIIGKIDENGAFGLPSDFWDQLQALVGKGSGQRLVLPAAAAPILPSLLAMEKPEAFLEYEILLANDFKELLDFTAKTSEEPLAKASTQFREIRERVGSQDIRQYLANRFVRQRLGEVLQAVPFHYSAKMLLLQASGSRPTWAPRKILAAELRRLADSTDWVLKIAQIVSEKWRVVYKNGTSINFMDGYEFSSADIIKIGQIYDQYRARVDTVERYVDKKDLDLYECALKDTATLRNLDKALRSRGAQSFVPVRLSCTAFVESHKALVETLAKAMIELPPAPGS